MEDHLGDLYGHSVYPKYIYLNNFTLQNVFNSQ